MKWNEIQRKLQEEGYFCSKEIALAVQNAILLGKPLLIEGPAGVGKTELAKAAARIFDYGFIRLQCSPEMSERKALYDIDYENKLVVIQMLQNNIQTLVKEFGTLAEQVTYLLENNPVAGEAFLIKRPILQAFVPDDKKPKVLLIDELDKSSSEFDFSLLECFSDHTVSVPEIGTIHATHKPFTIITSNRARKIDDALLRRCVYLYIDYPEMEKEAEIITSKINCSDLLAKQVAQTVDKIRRSKVAQKPSIAESIEWANALSVYIEGEVAQSEEMKETVSIVAKNPSDRETVLSLV